MLACAATTNWMLSDDAFNLDSPTLAGDMHYTDAQTILLAAGVGEGEHPNVMGLSADEMAREIALIPAVAQVSVTTSLPNHVGISVSERVPVFAVHWSGGTYLVDSSGLVIADVDESKPAELGVPMIEDDRSSAIPEQGAAGATVDPIDLAAILQLGAVTPPLVDSTATSLQLSITDDEGFVLTAQPSGWQAIFGQYTPNLRPTDLIARQVQCLRSLLGAQESDVTTVYLAPLDERCGTYLPSAAPRTTPAPPSVR